MGQLEAAKFKKLHVQSGELIRWWKAIPVPSGTTGAESNGRKYTEQTINTAARFLVSSSTEEYESRDFGPIKTGTMTISAFPDWARFNHLDRVVLLGEGRAQGSMATVTRAASGTEDKLVMTPVKSITAVYVAGVVVSSANYAATETGINWLSGTPSAGVKYAVEYLYHPRYLVLPNRERTSPTDKRGLSLSLHYWLDLEMRSGNDEIL